MLPTEPLALFVISKRQNAGPFSSLADAMGRAQAIASVEGWAAIVEGLPVLVQASSVDLERVSRNITS